MALHKYIELNKALPKNIIVYRDGVGDGQLSLVHKNEVSKVKVSVLLFVIANLLHLMFGYKLILKIFF